MSKNLLTAQMTAAVLAVSLWVATPAVAADPASPPTVATADQPSADTATATATRETAKAEPVAAEVSNPVICRRLAVTGSRVRKETVCKTRSAWAADTKGAQEYLKSIERGSGAQPGGQSLPTGG